MVASILPILDHPYPEPISLPYRINAEMLHDSPLGYNTWPREEFDKFKCTARGIPFSRRWEDGLKNEALRRLFPRHVSTDPDISSFTNAYITGQMDAEKDVRVTYGDQMVRRVLAYRLMQEIAGEVAFSKSGLAVFQPISKTPEEEWGPYPFMDCQNFVLAQWLTPQEMRRLSEATGYSFYYIRYKAMNLIDRLLLDQFRPVEITESIKPYDVILYSADDDFFALYGAHHFARVVAVCGEKIWVESKWGNFDRPCVHLVDDVPSSYGDKYFVARIKDSDLLPNTDRSIEAAGYSLATQIDVKERSIFQATEKRSLAYSQSRLADFYENF